MSNLRTETERTLREAQLLLAHSLSVHGPSDAHTKRAASLVRILRQIRSAQRKCA